jgi:fluoride exporter
MKELLIVGCGGFVGAIMRYLAAGWAQKLTSGPFPLGTLTVNSIGSLVIGIVAGLTQKAVVSPDIRMFVSIGLLGAFTTFSTFSFETMMLLRSGSYGEAVLNVMVSLLLGLVLVYLGYIAGQAIV